ncbi:GyrI-like domain-containing protein [Paenibacillus sp. FSL M7-1455]|uniref:GyrI-like domain-containing protein n=1 Tax=Paenibacillus sp. FSL M7-1455 TaxID=2975316 RepID=UPI0030F78528
MRLSCWRRNRALKQSARRDVFVYHTRRGICLLKAQGPLSQINETFEELIAWLRKNDYEQFDVVCFEVYDERFKGEQPESEIDMYIQIK